MNKKKPKLEQGILLHQQATD
uniref:Uncharacterized protein n=1 Tax=Anguilla anguilla TaxID=7936 RepID=A0A0E9Q4C9_ANGAN